MKVDPVLETLGGVVGSLHFKDIMSDANGSVLDVTPVSNKLGANLDLNVSRPFYQCYPALPTE